MSSVNVCNANRWVGDHTLTNRKSTVTAEALPARPSVSSLRLPCVLPTPGNWVRVDQNWTGLPSRHATNTRQGSPTPSSVNHVAS